MGEFEPSLLSMPKFSDFFNVAYSYKYDKSGILRMLYSLLASQGELDYETNLALAVLNGDRVAARALADKIVEEVNQ